MTAPTPVIDPAALLRLPNLAAALAKVQAKLPKLERDRTVEVQQKNGGTYSYSYVTLANLNDSILPLLAEHGLAFVALPGTGSDGKMAVRYLLLHESGETLPGEFPISGEGGIQMIGGRITYARRYVLAAIAGVAADEDDESRLADDGGPRTAQRATARPKQQRPAVEPAGDGQQTAQRAPRPARPAAGAPPLPGEDQAAGPAPAGGISTSQRGMLMGQLDKLGITDREVRLRTLSTLVGRPLESSNELTRAEASELINIAAEALKSDDPRAVMLAALAAAAETAGGNR